VTEQNRQEPTATPSIGPGQRLKEARERVETEIDEIARALHLSVESVKALEQDNYHSFAAPAYVRGYLRNYARLVDISENAILAQFDQASYATQRPEIKGQLPTQKPPTAHAGKLIALLLLATALAGVGWLGLERGWFQSDETTASTEQSSSQILDLNIR